MKTETIVLGGGCFWCLDASYGQVDGVTEIVSGFAGGSVPNPSSDAVYTGKTGHAEVVQVTFDTAKLSLADILDMFWVVHNPTTLNRQNYDVGTMYRSIILYANGTQQKVIEASVEAVAKLWPDPIVTQVVALANFYPAEDYHQHYFAKNPSAAYCQIVINPKLAKLRQKFADKLK